MLTKACAYVYDQSATAALHHWPVGVCCKTVMSLMSLSTHRWAQN